jgi:hypothetical protein
VRPPVAGEEEAAGLENDAYDQLGATLDVVIAEALGLTFPASSSEEYAVIKRADNRALLIEARELLHDQGARIADDLDVDEASLRDLEVLGKPLLPDDARRAFIAAHERLTGPSEKTRSSRLRR